MKKNIIRGILKKIELCMTEGKRTAVRDKKQREDRKKNEKEN